MLDFVGLLVDRLGDFVIAVADADRENAAEEVEELLAVGVVDVLVLGVVDDQRFVVIGRHARKKILLLLIDDFFFVHVFPVV